MSLVVVDVGNTGVKWGLCSAKAVVEMVSLPPDADAWHRQAEAWKASEPLLWVVAGVHPERRDRLVDWLQRQGEPVRVLNDWRQLPLTINLANPERAGIDRLLDAVAANTRRRPETPAVVIDAGSAVTVDWIDHTGSFCGGAIFPGLRLMAEALHQYTALLPLVPAPSSLPPLPGLTTTAAMQAGIFWAVVGGTRALWREMAPGSAIAPQVFLTGGDGPLLHAALGAEVLCWPEMTLEGIRQVAEANP